MLCTARTFERTEAAPFLKWAGGKGQLLSSILPRLPRKIGTYYEPFIGGGAVFFSLAREGRFSNAVIADRNPSLVEAYRTVRDDVEALVDALTQHATHATSPDYFYELRAMDGSTWSSVERTARLLYLNKTCFNGLYRVNRRGQFNVPFGKYARPRVLDANLLRACSRALCNVEIVNADFAETCKAARRNDAVYFDPPYVPVSATSSFTAYDALPFGASDHERLAATYRACCARGAAAVLSNSDCAFTRALYRDLEVTTVHATRAINSVASRRGSVTEVLVVGLAKNGARLQGRSTAKRQRKAA